MAGVSYAQFFKEIASGGPGSPYQGRGQTEQGDTALRPHALAQDIGLSVLWPGPHGQVGPSQLKTSASPPWCPHAPAVRSLVVTLPRHVPI
jgi:hypothetical protein